MADPIISPNAQVPGMSGMNGVINGQDPNYIYSLMQAQRQKQIADALTQESLSGIQYDPKGKISPLQGLAKMLDAYVGAKGAQASNRTLADIQSQGMQNMARAYGVGQPPQAASMAMAQGAQQQPSAPDLGGALVNQGGVGPTVQNAGRMNTLLANGLSGSPQSPQNTWTTRGAASPLNPGGAPAMLNFAAAQGDPAAKVALEQWFKDNAPTDLQKNSRDFVVGAPTVSNLYTQNMTPMQKLQLARSQAQPGSPEQQQLDEAIKKENYVAPIDAKPGTPVIDPITHNLIAFAPKTADGINVGFGKDASGALVPTGTNALPGYAQANAGIAGAEQGARQSNTIISAPGPGGSTVTNFGGSLVGQPPSQQPIRTGGPNPTPTSNFQGPPAKVLADIRNITDPQEREYMLNAYTQKLNAGNKSGLTGQSTADAQINESAGKTIAALPQSTMQANQVKAGLETALQALENTKSGPGTEKGYSLTALLQNMGLPVAQKPTENYQTLTKYLNNSLAISAAVNGNTGSDSRFEQFLHGQPNADLMNKTPLRGAINYVLSQIDAVPVGAKVVQDTYLKAKAEGDQNAAYSAQKAWQDRYDPKAFQFNRMSPEEKAQFKSDMVKNDPQGAQAFGAKYNQFVKNGWVK